MDEEGFKKHLRKSGRSQSAIKRILSFAKVYEEYLMKHRNGIGLDEASPGDLEVFVSWFEKESGDSAKTYLWAIRHYYIFTSNQEMRKATGMLREERVSKKRKPMVLSRFVGVDKKHTEMLASLGIVNINQMLESGRTRDDRQELARRSGLQESVILEFVKLSDLARIPGVKNIRARLYHDAGVDTIEKMAQWNPMELREMLVEFVEKTGFKGVAPMPKEAQCAIETARKLSRIVEY